MSTPFHRPRSPDPRPPAPNPGVALLAACLLAAVPGPAATPAAAQDVDPAGERLGPRPVPDPVVAIPEYRRAVESGTRSGDGAPGPEYWQQWTEYRIRARLDPGERRLESTTRVRYHNRSPDTLRALRLHLHQNLHASGTVRNEPQEVTGGVEILRVEVEGRRLRPEGWPGASDAGADDGGGPRSDGGRAGRGTSSGSSPSYSVDATILEVELPDALPPGGSADLTLETAFTVPQAGAGRMGWSGDDLFFLGYWYPQMAVYDDVVGWHVDPYLGRGEFYMGYGSYDVAVEVPEGWVVRATGRLQNPGAVFPDEVRTRLERAGRSDTVVHVLTREDFGPGKATRSAEDGWLTWRFAADSVRDFAFSATRRSLWDAARAPVGDRDGDGEAEHARVEALYRPEADRWRHTWRYAGHSLDFLSRFTGFPYPWSHMTAVEGGGIIGGGMEYPMMTIMGDYEARGDSALYYVTAHELAHMWIPMVVGTDEKRYAWMDEGAITFLENRARKEFFPGRDHDAPDREDYLEVARAGDEAPVMTWMDYQPPPAGNVPNYDKPATLLVALRHVLGEEAFREALSTFVFEWAYRHPYPWDFFRIVERVSGRELGWFWRSWYYETWSLDHAVADVEQADGAVTVTVADRGWGILPARVRITLEDGTVLERTLPPDAWLDGSRRATVTVEAPSPAARVELDPGGVFPDVDRSNDVWTGGG